MCAEMLQAIQGTYHRSIAMVAENVPHMLGQVRQELREKLGVRVLMAIAVCVQTQFTLKRIFQPIKKKLEKKGERLDDTKASLRSTAAIAESRSRAAQLDVLAAVNLGCSLLETSPTLQRQVVLNIALSVAQLKNMLRVRLCLLAIVFSLSFAPRASTKQNHADEVRYQLWKLKLLGEWQKTVRRLCDCSFLYWCAALCPRSLD